MKQLNLFIELTRLKKPIGFMLLFWPCAWGFQLGVNVNDELIALNGVRIENNIDDLFLKLGEPKELTLVVNRAGLLREIKGNFSTFPEVKYEFLLPATVKGDDFWEGAGAIQTLLK